MTDFVRVHVKDNTGRFVGEKFVNFRYVTCLAPGGDGLAVTVHYPEVGQFVYEAVMPFRRYTVDDVALHLLRKGPE